MYKKTINANKQNKTTQTQRQTKNTRHNITADKTKHA